MSSHARKKMVPAAGTAAAARDLYNRGHDLWLQGKPDEAIRLYDAALAIRPDYPEALCAGGFILQQAGKNQEAMRFYDQALKHRPNYAVALANRGLILMAFDAPEAAIDSFRDALKADPSDAKTWTHLGAALNEVGRFVEALPFFDEAARLAPELAPTFHNRGHAYLKLHRLGAALADFEQAIRLQPNYAAAICGKAVTFKELDRLDEAAALFEEALRLEPLSDHTLSNKAALLLLHGSFPDGWELYEHRWKSSNNPGARLRLPRLDYAGQLRAGDRVLVWDDQALGDIVQFCRFLPMLRDAGAGITLLARKSAHRLLGSQQCGVEMIERLTSNEDFTWQIALGSLPRAFGVDFSSASALFPQTEIPYLAAEPELVDRWRDIIGTHGFKVGLCWQGSTDARADIKRSFPIETLSRLADIDGVRLISLQKGEAGEAAVIAASGLGIEHLGEAFDSGPDAFIDTAAVMKNLDLVISCDTSVAHLAGALGVPTWVALKRVPEWRWLLGRDDSPWYPSMRLFRQRARDDWASIFDAMAEALSREARSLDREAKIAKKPADVVIHLPCSVGELIDKMTILAIKHERIGDSEKRANVGRELALLDSVREREGLSTPALDSLEGDLRAVNAALWDIEDAIRLCERRGDFGIEFVELARKVYQTNDRRAAIKREINLLFGSAIVEEKSYAA